MQRMTRLELDAIGADLVQKLGGHWSNGRGMCRCPIHADKSPSLSVRVGDTNLLFHCFAGCETIQILRWFRQWKPEALAAAAPSQRPQTDVDAWVRSRATELWEEARELSDSPAALYLRFRGLDVCPAALRYHPHTPLGRGRDAVRRPSMLARVSDDRRILAVQRSFLDKEACTLSGDLANPRRMLARPERGAVRLFEPDRVLGLAEGVETALSAAILLQIPVWAVLGNERFAQIAIPRSVARIILLPDNDRAGRRGVAAAKSLYDASGVEVEIVLPWRGLNDWNDVLRGGKPA